MIPRITNQIFIFLSIFSHPIPSCYFKFKWNSISGFFYQVVVPTKCSCCVKSSLLGTRTSNLTWLIGIPLENQGDKYTKHQQLCCVQFSNYNENIDKANEQYNPFNLLFFSFMSEDNLRARQWTSNYKFKSTSPTYRTIVTIACNEKQLMHDNRHLLLWFNWWLSKKIAIYKQ